MEFFYSKLEAYKLQPSSLDVFKILEISRKNVRRGVSFYRSRC